MQPRPVDTGNVPTAGGETSPAETSPTDTSPRGTSPAESAAGGRQPAEGRPDLGIPGADREDVPADRNDDLPERLGQRIENGSSSGLATGEPDVLPDVEVPEETM